MKEEIFIEDQDDAETLFNILLKHNYVLEIFKGNKGNGESGYFIRILNKLREQK